MNEKTIYTRVFDVKKLIYPRAEMKAILRAKTTSDRERLVLKRAVELIDNIMSSGVSIKEYKKRIQKETAKEIRSKLRLYK